MQLIREPLLYRSSPLLQLLSFLVMILVSLLFTLIIGMLSGYLVFGSGIMDYIKDGGSLTSPELLPMLKYLQVINTLGLFVFPPLIFAFLVSKKPSNYLAVNKTPAIVSTFLGVGVIVVILPFLHWTANLNEMMELPEWLESIERWMKNSEDQARELTELFLSTTSYRGLAINLLMIALLPAIGEELLFRGVLLRLFREMTKNSHLAVLISAFLFSALHLQFYGFLPRFILGAFLGYLFVWTRSIWVPIVVHLCNNGIAVVTAWLYERGAISTSAESLGDNARSYMIITSLVMVIILTLMIMYYEGKKKGSTIE